MENKQARNIKAVDVGFIRAEVARKRLVYRDIAEALGISQEELSKKVNERTAFSVCEVDLLADVLGCTTDQLFGRA